MCCGRWDLVRKKIPVIKQVILYIFIFIIPLLITYFGQSNYITKNICTLFCKDLNEEQLIAQTNVIKDILLLIGIVITGFTYIINLAYLKINKEKYHEQQQFLITYIKNIFVTYAKSKYDLNDLSIRVFIPKKSFKNFIYKKLNKLKIIHEFSLVQIEGLSDNGIYNNLSFEVFPTSRGLVGDCYTKRDMVFNANLLTTTKDYNLKDIHKSQTKNLGFCLCSPIFDTKGNIVAILAFDSTQTLKNYKKEDLAQTFDQFTKVFAQNCPKLFI